MLQEVKDHLKITWNDEDADIQKIIDRGKSYLNDLIGVELNFDENNQAKTLLLNFCRYNYNNALEYFEDNFQKEILRLQLKEAVSANEVKI